ncbi:MAG: NYN domain-containing protein [Acetobacteraceae bacterium]|nr:NYN domain-containing protein [Acetobacteraceae bacterium]MDW8398847.1 NYN domain-containing protein [Acetobacteraceae bacterium]
MAEAATALFLDFDNVLSGLREGAGAAIAHRFATEPGAWLPFAAGDPSRCLVRRCYLNPAGFLEAPVGERAWFGEFRWAFQAAGFEVVDCPRITRLKNGADIRMAIDMLDALASPLARIERFVLMSTDADFVPLLLRLRAADRRTRLVAHPQVGRILRSAADEVIGLDALARHLGWRPEAEDETFGEDAAAAVQDAARQILAEAQAPLHLPHLGKLVRDRTGRTLRETRYGGAGSIEALLAQSGFVRVEGPGGGVAARPEWLAAMGEAAEAARPPPAEDARAPQPPDIPDGEGPRSSA